MRAWLIASIATAVIAGNSVAEERAVAIWRGGDTSGKTLCPKCCRIFSSKELVTDFIDSASRAKPKEIKIYPLIVPELVAFVDSEGRALRVFAAPRATRPHNQLREVSFTQIASGTITMKRYLNLFEGITVDEAAYKAIVRSKP